MLRQPAEQLRNEIQDLQQAAAGLGRIEELLSAALASWMDRVTNFHLGH